MRKASESKTDRVDRLTAMVQKAVKGDYGVQADLLEQDDELGPLTQAVKNLIERLQEETSAREMVEETLQKTSDKYQRLETNIPGMVYAFALHPDGTYSLPYVTPASREIFGLEPEETMRDWDRIYNLVHPDDRAKLDHSVRVSAETLQPWRELLRFIIRGEVRWYDCMSRPRPPEPNGDILWDGVVLDVTERKRAEEALEESELRFRSLMDYMPDVSIQGYRTDGTVAYWNKASEAVYGYPSDEALGKNLEDLIVPADLKPLFRECLALGKQVQKSGEFMPPGELMLLHKDGHPVPVYSMHTAVYIAGKEPLLYCLDLDLSERKRVEDELRAAKQTLSDIIAFLPDATFVLDRERKIIAWNKALEELTGTKKEDFLGKGDYAYAIPFYGTRRPILVDLVFEPDTLVAAKYAYLERRGTAVLGEGFIPRAHKGVGAYFWGVASPLYDSKGDVVGAIESVRDITERTRAEEKLRESEERFRQLAEVFPETIFEADLDGNLTYVNEHGLQRFGFTHEDFERGLNLAPLIAPADVERVMQQVQKRLAGKVGGFTEYRPRCKNGDTFDALALSAPIVRKGCVVGIRGFVLDITERKRSEEALRATNETLNAVLEAAPVAIVSMDSQGIITLWNQTAERMFGWSRVEALGHCIPYVPENKRQEHELMRAKALSGEVFQNIEVQRQRKDGSSIDISVSGAPIRSANGDVIGAVGVNVDITERTRAEEKLRESEERFRHLAELLPEGIYELDPQGRITYANRSALEQFGYSFSDLAEGLTAFDVVIPAQRAAAKENAASILQGGKTTLSEYVGLRKDGSTFPVVMHSAPVIRDEQTVGVRGVCINMTEKKHLEAQLVQAQKMECVGRLAGGVAHDFNNMLAVILGSAELIKSRVNENDPLLDHVSEIEHAACRSRDITSQLLAFSRKQIIAPRPLNLNDTALALKNTLARLIGEDIDLRFRPGKDTGKINVDPSQIDQILINLAVNARDAMPQGGKLLIETANAFLDDAYCQRHPGALSGPYVMLRVSDNGAGMDEEMLSYIFEPFFTTKEVGKGTGLGLATVYGTVKQNNGFIDVMSQPGRGATFEIYLPRLTEEDEKIVAGVDKTPEVFESGTVLLVEDNAMVRSITTEMLEAAGHKVFAFATPEEALKLCREESLHIDLLLTDVVLPGMSGRELKDSLDALRPGINTLFMSGYPSDVIAHHGVLEPGTHFIQKPFTILELSEKVREAMRKTVK